MHGMYGTLQSLRCSVPSKELSWRPSWRPSCVSSGNLSVLRWCTMATKGSIHGLWKGMRCVGPRAKDAELWIFLGRIAQSSSSIMVEVVHVRAHCSRQGMQQMSLLDSSSPNAMRKQTSWQKEAMLDGGNMAPVRATTAQREREEVYAALQYAASVHCLVRA